MLLKATLKNPNFVIVASGTESSTGWEFEAFSCSELKEQFERGAPPKAVVDLKRFSKDQKRILNLESKF